MRGNRLSVCGALGAGSHSCFRSRSVIASVIAADQRSQALESDADDY